MAAPVGKKLQIPQLERIRVANTHVADALEAIVANVNANTTPAAGNVVAPANSLIATTKAKVKPLNVLR